MIRGILAGTFIVGTLDIHFGMMSHGAFWHGGDRDIADAAWSAR